MKNINKTVLCIMDGVGINESEYGNAVLAARMENLNSAMAKYPSCQLKASGFEVGLSDEKDPGNSEVGHNAMGSGQIVKQGLALVSEGFETGEIFKWDGWKEISQRAKQTKLNVIFLLSDGKTHSYLPHLLALLTQCAKEKIKVSIHALADGRDVHTQSVLDYIDITREHIKKVGANAKIAIVGGRGRLYMDRYESNINLYIDGFRVSALGEAPYAKDIHEAVRKEYAKDPKMTDETLPAFVLEPDWLIKNGDAVLHLNYRGDRSVGVAKMFEHGRFLTKEQYSHIDKCLFAGVLQYDAEHDLPKLYMCSPPVIKNGLSDWLVEHGIRQYSVTETVKFGHLTYFFNGNREGALNPKLEVFKEYTSDVCFNRYDKAPEMKAHLITDDAIEAIKSEKYDFIRLNLANPDMVGHTGVFEATVIGCKTVDNCLAKIIDACKTNKTNLIITADHGLAEIMLHPDGRPHSNHTASPVPFVVLPFAIKNKTIGIKKGNFGLTNIASAICELLGVPASSFFRESLLSFQ